MAAIQKPNACAGAKWDPSIFSEPQQALLRSSAGSIRVAVFVPNRAPGELNHSSKKRHSFGTPREEDLEGAAVGAP